MKNNMNNIIISVKRFLKNKNTVTILGVIVIMAILYFGYNMQLKKLTSPVSVPVAKSTIQPRTKITQEMITTISIPSVGVQGNVILSSSLIVGKYTNVNTIIPQGSMFYSEALIKEEDLPDSSYTQVKEGEIPYNFAVDMNSTYGNSIFPGNKIDLYMKAESDDGQVMVGKLIENVEVLAVKDSSGKDVFENTAEDRIPAFLIFGVEEEIHILLRKTQYMTSNNITVFPVPHGGAVDESGKTRVSTQYLKDFINSKTVNIPIEVVDNGNQTVEGE